MYYLAEEEQKAAMEVIKSGELFRYWSSDSKVAAFEAAVAEKFGVKYVLAVNGGTSSLITALFAAGVGPGDEVMVPAYTWIATPASVVVANAVPIIAEVDNSLTLDPNDVEAKITPRTKAIMPVHMIGAPSDMQTIMALARKYNLLVIEDCAQAIGGAYGGKRLGTHGQIGCFSLQLSKIISTGEGGIVVTDDEELYDRARMCHDGGGLWGRSKYPNALFAGMNFRMDEVRGAIAGVQLTRLDGFIEKMREQKSQLKEALRDVNGIEFRKINDVGDTATCMVFYLPTAEIAVKFAEAMGRHGVGAGTMYAPGRGDWHIYCYWDYIMDKKTYHPSDWPYSHPAYEGKVEYSRDMCPKTLDYLGRAINIGISPFWENANIEKIANAIKAAAKEVF
ncbi:DegT/DnrJ/EryC1/StrS family aminotransferase [Candidatus Poribacteria bacterium]|nr:DegT/DnrJ/EryC1/StrS family aminotransferase [Candidatus Poribacteria bacterium]